MPNMVIFKTLQPFAVASCSHAGDRQWPKLQLQPATLFLLQGARNQVNFYYLAGSVQCTIRLGVLSIPNEQGNWPGRQGDLEEEKKGTARQRHGS